MPIRPARVEDLAAGTRGLAVQAEEHALSILARHLAAGLDAPRALRTQAVRCAAPTHCRAGPAGRVG